MSYDFYLRQIVHGDMKPLHIDLHNSQITLGGNEYIELKQYSKVSHPHASIENIKGQWYVKDLNSFYGTFVNGFSIGTKRHRLQIGDQIGLGSIENGFICALSVKPVKIKKEPVELIDISDNLHSIKNKTIDNCKVSDLSPKETCTVPKTAPSGDKIITDPVKPEKGNILQNLLDFPLHEDSRDRKDSLSLCPKDSINAINNSLLQSHPKLNLVKENVRLRNSEADLTDEGYQRIDLGAKYNNDLVNEKRNPCETNSRNKENVKMASDAAEIGESGASKVEGMWKTKKRKRLYSDSKKDTVNKSQRNCMPISYDSDLYSSDVAALLKDNSCVSLNIEDNSEVNSMDIDGYSQNKMVMLNSNPEIGYNNKNESNPHTDTDNYNQVIGHNQASDSPILEDLLLQMSCLPAENKICTNFISPFVPAKQQKCVAESQPNSGFFNENSFLSNSAISSSRSEIGNKVPLTSSDAFLFPKHKLESSKELFPNTNHGSSSVSESQSKAAYEASLSDESLLSTSVLQSIISSVKQNTPNLSASTSFPTCITSSNKSTFMPLITDAFSIDPDQVPSANLSSSLDTGETLNVSEDYQCVPILSNEKEVSHFNSLPVSKDNSSVLSTSVLNPMSKTTSMSSTSELPLISTSMLKSIISSINQNSPTLSTTQKTLSDSEVSCNQNPVIPINNSNFSIDSNLPLEETSGELETSTSPFDHQQDSKWLNNWIPITPTNNNYPIARIRENENIFSTASTSVFKSEPTTVSQSSKRPNVCIPISSKTNELSGIDTPSSTASTAILNSETATVSTTTSSFLHLDPPALGILHEHSLTSDDCTSAVLQDKKWFNNQVPDTGTLGNDKEKSTLPAALLAVEESKWLNNWKTIFPAKENALLGDKASTNKCSEISRVTISESVLQTTPTFCNKQLSMDHCNTSLSHTDVNSQVMIAPQTISTAVPVILKTNEFPDGGQNLVISDQQLSSQNANDNSKQTHLEIIKNIIEFDVKCLKEQTNDVHPPFLKLKSLAYLPLHFSSLDHYSSSFLQLLTLEVWKHVHQESKPIWDDSNNTFNLFYFTVLSFETSSYMDEFHCEALVNEILFSPTKGNVVIMKIRGENNKYYSKCCYTNKHSIEELDIESLNPEWKKFGDEQLNNFRLWKFSVFVKSQTVPPVLNQLMRGNGICSVEKYLHLADGLEHLKSSPLRQNILNPKQNTFCERSKRTLILTHSKAVKEIANEILEAPLEPKVILLQGAPGTGKTKVIVNLIKKIVTQDEKFKILVTASSNSTLDDIGSRLIKSKLTHYFVRLGQICDVDDCIKPFCLDNKAVKTLKKRIAKKNRRLIKLTSNTKIKRLSPACQSLLLRHNSGTWITTSKLKCTIEEFASARVVLSTLDYCSFLDSFPFTSPGSLSTFSCCIVDDATSCTELEVLQSLVSGANKLLLIGDSHQTPSEGISNLAVSYGFNRSMFARFNNYVFFQNRKKLILELKEQFRMHPEIWHFPSKRFYSETSLTMQDRHCCGPAIFPQPYCVYDILGDYDKVIARICGKLRIIKKTQASIGIIIPSKDLRSHYVEHILKNDKAYDHIEIDTVDAFQGREKDFIILSCGKSLSDNPSFLSCRRSMIVALTRARKCLIICLCSNILSPNADWQHLIDNARARAHYKILTNHQSIQKATKNIITKISKIQNI